MLVCGCGTGNQALKKEGPVYLADASEGFPPPEGQSDADFLEFGFEEDTAVEKSSPSVNVSDPLGPWNRMMFKVNDKLYLWVLKPVATGYKKVVPEIARTGLRNFFNNVSTPVRLANCVLQGKGEKACHEIGRFLVNSTIGFLGLGDPASSQFNMKSSDEDLGQTLAVYGAGNGFYIVWPMVGPSTFRDTLGTGGEYFFDPVNFAEVPYEIMYGCTALEKMNSLSFRLGDYESLKNAAIDPYDAFRDFYIQYREKKVKE